MGAMQTRRREMALVLLLGVAGAGLVFLAVRQGWAHVRTAPPPPLPGSDSPVTGQDLVPAAAALAVAALASLAAVLATRGIARRLVGLALAGLGAGIAAALGLPVTTADAIAAVSGRAGYRGAAESGAAGSATAGGGHGGGAPLIAGFPAHVAATAFPWRLLALAGGAAVIAAGLLVIWRAAAWPVMSSRFDPPERPRPRQVPLAARPVPDAADAASIWESLSRGEDPTSGGPG
jgi:uncharacterized membrane protein (TIGR02234 family)